MNPVLEYRHRYVLSSVKRMLISTFLGMAGGFVSVFLHSEPLNSEGSVYFRHEGIREI